MWLFNKIGTERNRIEQKNNELIVIGYTKISKKSLVSIDFRTCFFPFWCLFSIHGYIAHFKVFFVKRVVLEIMKMYFHFPDLIRKWILFTSSKSKRIARFLAIRLSNRKYEQMTSRAILLVVICLQICRRLVSGLDGFRQLFGFLLLNKENKAE